MCVLWVVRAGAWGRCGAGACVAGVVACWGVAGGVETGTGTVKGRYTQEIWAILSLENLGMRDPRNIIFIPIYIYVDKSFCISGGKGR